MSSPAIFIDRDGTLNEDRGYLSALEDVIIYPWAVEAVSLINRSGAKAIVVTNQSGIARGLCSEADVRAIHNYLTKEFARQGASLDGVYYCPHHPRIGEPPYCVACDCRKPQPGLVQRAAAEHDIDVERSYVVGDKLSDLELARNVGARAALVLTGYGLHTKSRLVNLDYRPDITAANLLEAVQVMLRRLKAAKS